MSRVCYLRGILPETIGRSLHMMFMNAKPFIRVLKYASENRSPRRYRAILATFKEETGSPSRVLFLRLMLDYFVTLLR